MVGLGDGGVDGTGMDCMDDGGAMVRGYEKISL